jgi:hypothetical protein
VTIKITVVNKKTGEETTTIIEGDKASGYVLRDGKLYKKSFIDSILYGIKEFISMFIK